MRAGTQAITGVVAQAGEYCNAEYLGLEEYGNEGVRAALYEILMGTQPDDDSNLAEIHYASRAWTVLEHKRLKEILLNDKIGEDEWELVVVLFDVWLKAAGLHCSDRDGVDYQWGRALPGRPLSMREVMDIYLTETREILHETISYEELMEMPERERVEVIVHYFHEMGYSVAPPEDFYKVRNSSLLIVTSASSPIGIPITLAAVITALCRMHDIYLYPINFPAVFMLRGGSRDASDAYFVDPRTQRVSQRKS